MKKIHFQDLIVKESDDYIFINKPPFISTLEDRAQKTNILRLAKTYFEDSQVCHRLDKETSGVLAIAKNANAYSHLSKLLEKRKVEKIYHAVSSGIHNFQDLTIDAPITAMSNGVVKIDNLAGKKAATTLNTIKAFRKSSLIQCRPETGRMHQIRIHLALMKAPILEDLQYGGKHFYLSSLKRNYNLKRDTDELPLIKRVALHAFSLQFKNLSGDETIVEAPYPKDFAVLIKQLERYN